MKKLLAITTSILLLLITLISLILFTPVGLRLTLMTTHFFTPYHLKASQVSGTLMSSIELQDVHLHYHKNDVAISKIDFSWSLTSLLKKQVKIQYINAGYLTIRHNTTSSTRKPLLPTSTPLKLPIPIHIQHVNIESVSLYHQNKLRLHAKNITGHTQLSNDLIDTHIRLILTTPFSRQNEIKVKGKLSQYQFSLSSSDNTTQILLSGTGNQNSIQFSAKNSHIANGLFSTKTSLQWYPYLQWKTDSQGSHLSINSLFDPVKEPPLNISLQSEGQWNPTHPELTINSQLKSSNTDISIQGTLNTHSAIQWSVNTKNINLFFPNKKGSIASQGTITGDIKAPTISYKASSHHPENTTLKAQYLESAGQIHLNKSESSSITLKATDTAFRNTRLKSIHIEAKGPINHFQIKTHTVGSQDGTLSTLSSINITPNLITHTLQSTTLITPQHHTWQQTAASTQQFNKHSFKTDAICLTSQGALKNACVTGSWERHGDWEGEIEANEVPLDILSFWYTPQLITLDGTFSLNANLKGLGNKISKTSISAHLNPGQLSTRHGTKTIKYPYQSGQMNVSLKNKVLLSTLRIQLNKNDNISSELKLPNASIDSITKKTQPIEGSLAIKIKKIDLNNLLLPYVNISNGSINSNLTIAGTLKKPIIKGPLNINQLDLKLPKLGLKLTDAQCQLEAKDNSIDYHLSLLSDNNPLTLTGNADLTNNGWVTKAHLTGKKILISNTPKYKIKATPDLLATIKGYQINVTGDLDVSDTQITIPSSSGIIKLPTSDITYIDRQRQHFNDLWVLTGKVNGTVSDNVTLDLEKFGVTGLLNGALTIYKKAHQDLSANGEISIHDGIFEHYGSKLPIEPHSNINFTNSPITNPNLNLKASKTINQLDAISQSLSTRSLTVGIAVTGTTANPEISFYSSPDTLSDTDIISYLILGHPFSYTNKSNYATSQTETTSNSSAVQIFDAIRLSESGLSEKSGITNSVERQLGLSEMGVEAGDTVDAIGTEIGSQAYFVVGRYLSKRLYLRYSSGLIDPISIIQLRYYLSPQWMVQMSTSSTPSGTTDQSSNALDNDSGADILYTIEK